MKTKLIALLTLATAVLAFGHGEIELGPNKGRILEFSNNETMHGEVTEREGKLHIALLDKNMKPVAPTTQSLAATAGTREKPQKLETTQGETGFTLPAPGEDEWLILQYKETPDAKPITARMHYNVKKCEPCGSPEWRCACGEKK